MNQEIENRFCPAQMAKLDPSRVPTHIAIIPDGNRRWAKKSQITTPEGHREGADSLVEIVDAASDLGIQIITFYAFSYENWTRPKEEIAALMALYASFLLEQKEKMIQKNIKFDTIGDLTKMPSFLNQIIEETRIATQDCTKLQLVLAFNYGGRNEICRAFHTLLQECEQNKLNKKEINESMISRYLDTHKWKDPELLIRTSGEFRISNFLLWQISYAEIFISPVLWPDFRPQHLLEAVLDFQGRERRWGGGI